MTEQEFAEAFDKAIKEVLSQVDGETAKEFSRQFNKKLQELKNDQQTNLQKDSGASR